jgi:hypothetical protein
MIMPDAIRRVPCSILVNLAVGFGSIAMSAAVADQPADRTYVDEDYAFKVAAPSDWQRVNPAGLAVPGEICRAWSPDQLATIVIFVQKPGEAVRARDVLDQSAAAMKSSGCDINEQAVKKVAGVEAMWLAVTGKGTGGALDGKGDVRTSQRWVALPREKDVIVLLLTAPEADFKQRDDVFQAMLKTLSLTGKR